MEQLQSTFNKLLKETSTSFHRYMYNHINWDARMIGLIRRKAMRKYMIILAAALINMSCSSQGKKAESPTNNAQPEAKETAKFSESADGKPSNAVDGKVNYLTTADFKKKVMDYEAHPQEWTFAGSRPAVIDFYATWCRPCKMMSPIMEQLAKLYAGKVDFYKVDIDKEPELAAVFGIQSIPTFLFIPQKGTPSMQMGMMEKEKMEEILGTLK